jgi:NodT family efflux transporter outer membrane factor (OMF) lipoprotein
MRQLVFALVLSSLAMACSVKPPPQVEPDLRIETPDGWTATPTEGDRVADDWWTSFGDPVLNSLVEIALAENRDPEAAAARLSRAEALARIAGADLKPSVSAGVDGSRGRQNFVGLPIPGSEDNVLSTTSSRVGVSVDLSWEIDLWGRIRAGTRAAIAELQAADAELSAARLSIAGQTAKAWFAVNELAEQLRLAEDAATSFRGTAEQVRSRFKQGIRPAVDLRLALSNLADAEALVEQRARELNITVRQLEILLNRYPSGRLLDEFALQGLPELDAPVPAGLPAELLTRRPDLVSVERTLAAAGQRVREARRSLYPRLSLTAGGGTLSAEVGDLLGGDFLVWNLGVNLLQPIYQGGRLRANVALNEATEQEVLALYASAVLFAFSEVESSLIAEKYLAREEVRLAESAEHAIAAFRLSDQRYRFGIGDYLPVLESQTRSVTRQIELLIVQRLRLANRVDLFLSLGGGFDGHEDLTLPVQIDGAEEEDSTS